MKYETYLIENGYISVSSADEADFVILWTCAFREDMLNNSLSYIYDIKNLHNSKPLYIAGCMPDICPSRLSVIDGITFLPWKSDFSLMQQYFPPMKNKDFSRYDNVYSSPPQCGKHPLFHDQFIKLVVSEGCNEVCSYCSERLAHPPYKSFSIDSLVSACSESVKESDTYKVILLADSLGEYGCDTGFTLIQLINALCKIDNRIKIVLNNLNPVHFLLYLEEFGELIKENKIEHINLPIQSACDRVLSLMKRRYDRKEISKLFDFLFSKTFTKFDTHIIVGFPTETAEEFNDTVDFLLEKHPSYVLASPCLELPGTVAWEIMPKIPEDEKKRRLLYVDKKLSSAGIIVNTPINKFGINRRDEILSERGN
jgi:tRNA A37 methylthiotransferase MiaB